VQLLCNACNSLKGDIPAYDWEQALCNMHASELELRPLVDPARGPAWSPEQKQQWLRRWLATNIWQQGNVNEP
jgi:hypothetical protein